MSCSLTYNGKRFDTTEQLKEYVKTLPLSEQKRINSSDNLEFINARSKYQDELLEKFDPQTLLEISQSIGSRVSFIIDALCAKNTYKGMNRDTAIRATWVKIKYFKVLSKLWVLVFLIFYMIFLRLKDFRF